MALTKVSRGLLSTSIVDNGNATAITIDSSENVTFSGTATMDDAHVPSSGSYEVGGTASGTTAIGSLSNSAGKLTLDTDSTRSIHFKTGGNLRQFIDGSTGDISFYEDTGTTPKMVWSSSAESLGINVTDPIYPLEVQGEVGIELYNASGGGGVLNLRPSLGDANKYNMSISSYDHSGGGTGPADGISINAFDGVSIATGSSTARQERLRIDASGRVTMPSQPAFSVRPSSSQNNLPINGNRTVIFGTEVFDQGGNFASNTFTAPVTGRYQFNAAIYCLTVDSATEYVQLALRTSNRLYYYIFSTNTLSQDAFYMSFPLSVLADMDAGDTATLEFQLPNSGTAQMDVNPVSYFSGYLVA